MKVLVLALLCVAVAVAIPVELDANTQILSLDDIDNEQAISYDENPQEVARSKRFLVKKVILAKALGLGALGIGLVPAIGGIGGGLGGGGLGGLGGKFNGNDQQQQSYASGYWKPNVPVTTVSAANYPSVYPAYPAAPAPLPAAPVSVPVSLPQPQPQPIYYTSQAYGPPPQAYNVGASYASGISSTNAVVGYAPNQIQSEPIYGVRSAAVPPPQHGRQVFVVCDQNEE